jgi:hypothetical protein
VQEWAGRFIKNSASKAIGNKANFFLNIRPPKVNGFYDSILNFFYSTDGGSLGSRLLIRAIESVLNVCRVLIRCYLSIVGTLVKVSCLK